jgi:hypothetical protein
METHGNEMRKLIMLMYLNSQVLLQYCLFNYQTATCSFPGSSREVKAPEDVSARILQKLRGRTEFTVLVTLKQEHLNSGVILSIHHSEQRYGQIPYNTY